MSTAASYPSPGGRARRDRPGRRRCPGAQGGFTLIELIVTLMILAVLAGAAAPALLNPPRPASDLEEATGRFAALFRMARDSAVQSARSVTVVIDSSSGLVWFDQAGRLWDDYGLPGRLPAGSEVTAGSALRTEGAFGGGSTLGRGLAAPGEALQAPAGAQSLELPAGVRMEFFQPRTLFTFTPTGSAMGDSLLLRTSGGQMRLITVDPWSGRVRIR